MSKLLKNLPNLKQEKWIGRSLSTIVNMAGEELDRLDWKILAASLLDMEKGFKHFIPIVIFVKLLYLVLHEYPRIPQNIKWQ